MTMLDHMRRHKAWLKWSLGLVVLAFVLLYVPSFMDAGGASSFDTIATVEGRDIKAGNFRILEYGEAREITKDPQTGFRIQTVAGCKVAKTLLAEADAYNQAMRDWHAKNPPKP